MPFVAGESLRARLEREQQLPIEDAVRITREAASALDYAHRQGVIHRDIKPENILLHEGTALVADFGIALAVTAAAGKRLTQTGLSLGTPQYMSPEQAMGERSIDARSDIYSLGAVTYEMLVGEPPFTGPTVQAIVGRIMTEEPRPLGTQRRSIPPHVEYAVHKALEKLPADRWATAAEFAAALEGGTAGGYTQAFRAPGRVAPATRGAFYALGAATLVATALALWGWLRPLPQATGVVRLTFVPPADAEIRRDRGRAIALSPDGARLAYVGPGRNGNGSTQLFLRALDDTVPVPVAGTDSAAAPFFSSDGRWLGYWVSNGRGGGPVGGGGRLMKVPTDGGAAIEVAGNASPGAAWTTDNYIIYASGAELRRIPAAGGRVDTLVHRDSTGFQRSPTLPEALPDGAGILFRRCTDPVELQCRVYVLGPEDSAARDLGLDAVAADYLPTGHLVYVRADGAVLAAPFDLRRREITGAAVPVLDRVGLSTDGTPQIAWSANGTLALVSGEIPSSELVAIDRNGTRTRLADEHGYFDGPRISPDGQRIVVSVPDPRSRRNAHLWVLDVPSRTLSQLTTGAGESQAAWSPDGRRIAYFSNRNDSLAPYTIPVDRSLPPQPVSIAPYHMRRGPPPQIYWRGNGQIIIAAVREGSDTARYVSFAIAGDAAPQVVGTAPVRDPNARLSPDGRWIATVSYQSGRTDVFLRPLAADTPSVPVTVFGGSEPVWGSAGNELFYQSGDSLYVAALRLTPTPAINSRTFLLRDADFSRRRFATNYDVFPGGARFVMIRPETQRTEATIVLNWFQDVRRRVQGDQ